MRVNCGASQNFGSSRNGLRSEAYFALPTTAARITPTIPPQFPPV